MESGQSNLQLIHRHRLGRFNPQRGRNWGINLNWFTSKQHQGYFGSKVWGHISKAWKIMKKAMYDPPPLCTLMELIHFKPVCTNVCVMETIKGAYLMPKYIIFKLIMLSKCLGSFIEKITWYRHSNKILVFCGVCTSCMYKKKLGQTLMNPYRREFGPTPHQ